MKNKGYFKKIIAIIFILLISFSFNFCVKADEYNEEEASNTETKEEIEVTNEEIKDDKNTQTKDEPLNVATVVKISVIVLLGTVVVYFLSKNEKDEEEVK